MMDMKGAGLLMPVPFMFILQNLFPSIIVRWFIEKN
ncbi:hypothetical protein ABHD89_000930 [Salinicoccus halitifaciens]|uniref:Uncharacterized protein n=1 Tax=Salinicoccus halitifaciens TaxID=1073415 RepID=A0ABV2E7Z0_9STAP